MSNDAKKPTPSNDTEDMVIIINGRKHEVHQKEISYEEITKLAFPEQTQEWLFQMMYSIGEDGQKQELLPGGRVKVRKGLIFYVRHTGKS